MIAAGLVFLGASFGCSALALMFAFCRARHLPAVRDDMEQATYEPRLVVLVRGIDIKV